MRSFDEYRAKLAEIDKKFPGDPRATVADLEAAAGKDERDWQQERAAFLLY